MMPVIDALRTVSQLRSMLAVDPARNSWPQSLGRVLP
jgi:hypothetical protein